MSKFVDENGLTHFWGNLKTLLAGKVSTTQYATSTVLGLVEPDGTTISNNNGSISVNYGTTATSACVGNDPRLSDARTPTSHTHGGISNTGTLTSSAVTVASGDYILMADGTSNLIQKSIAIGSSTTTYLRNDGTWGTPPDTNTHYASLTAVAGTATATSTTTTALTNGNVYLNHVENGAVVSSHKISGSGATVVTTDTSGNIIISSTDTGYTHPTHTAYASGLYKVTVDTLGHVTAATAVAKSDITALGIPAQDTDTHYTSSTVLASAADGTATSTTALTNGNVYLNHVENGAVVSSHKISGSGAATVTTDTSGNIVITSTNTVYTHPSYTAHAAGLYKVTVDALGHVSAATAVAKSDITALGIPAQDTTYSAATGSAAGLMSAADYTKLAAFGAASTYALKTDIASMYNFKGSVDTYAALTALTGMARGDVYNVVSDESTGSTGMNYAYNGTTWDSLGGTFAIASLSNSEIDTIMAS